MLMLQTLFNSRNVSRCTLFNSRNVETDVAETSKLILMLQTLFNSRNVETYADVADFI